MKKILSLLLALSLFFSLLGCRPAGDLNAPLQPELQVQTTEATEAVTEATEWLVEWPTWDTTEETEAVSENTQPPQEEEIVDPRPHPADVAGQNQQQTQQEQNPGQQPSAPTQPEQDSSQVSTEPSVTEPAATEPATPPATTAPTEAPDDSLYLDPDGHYTSKNDVALYIYLYHRLPNNYISKTAGNSQYGSYKNIPSSMNIGGDRFYNKEGHLPSGYTYYECDIGTSGGRSRGTRRIVFTTSGIVYYTSDHYNSFTRLY